MVAGKVGVYKHISVTRARGMRT